MTIRVYIGEGTSRNGAPLLVEELQKHQDRAVQGITSQEMCNSEDWKTKTTTLIFAGQSVTQFKKALGDEVLKIIQKQVYTGVFDYVGVCAGAAFASKDIKYRIKAVNNKDDIRISNTGLSMFNGLATGPCRSVSPLPFSGESENLHLITLRSLTDSKSFNAFHWGGPALIPTSPVHKDQGRILAFLQGDDTPMSLRVRYGHGHVTLYSYHPEIHAGNVNRWAEARSLSYEQYYRLESLAQRLDGTAFTRFLAETNLRPQTQILPDPEPIFAPV